MDKSHVNDFQALEDAINIFLKDNIGKYNETCRLQDIKLLKNKNIGFEIELNISCKYMDLEAIAMRKDKFIF